jgi:FkbM family methyltransferase
MYAPWLAYSYRTLRDLTSWRSFRQTPYGFGLAGNSEMATADFEPSEVNAFLRHCGTCDVVLDIGANVGFYSCLAANQGKHVVSFEPAPRNLKFLYRNLWSNGFSAVEVLPVALGPKPGLMPIYGFGGISSLVPGWAQAPDRPAGLVPVTTLDLVAANRFPGEQLFIKMDVEGFELDVLAGADETLNRSPKPTWMLEIMLASSFIPGGTSRKFAETFDVFWSHGYQCKILGQHEQHVSPETVKGWVRSGRVETGAHNFLFLGE